MHYLRQDGTRLTDAEAAEVTKVPPNVRPDWPQGMFVDGQGEPVTAQRDEADWRLAGGPFNTGKPADPNAYTVVTLTPELVDLIKRIAAKLDA